MGSNAGPTRSTLSLKGSAKLVCEFFDYSINSILFQRGIYPPEDFKVVKKYGLNMLVTVDDQVKGYIKKFMSQLQRWMYKGDVKSLVLVIVDKDTAETVERWQFDVHVDSSNGGTDDKPRNAAEKTESEIQRDIQALVRQITASVTFLPQLTGRCTFNVLVYASKSSEVPIEWEDSDERLVASAAAESVRLRNFSTNSHRVECQVQYRVDDTAAA